MVRTVKHAQVRTQLRPAPNPLWAIAIGMAVFFGAAAAIIGLG